MRSGCRETAGLQVEHTDMSRVTQHANLAELYILVVFFCSTSAVFSYFARFSKRVCFGKVTRSSRHMSRRVHAYEKAGLVLYQPKIVDGSGVTETWSFEHQVAPDVLQKAQAHAKAAAELAEELAASHADELLAARPWKCCVCRKEKALQLLQHPVPYMKLLQVGATARDTTLRVLCAGRDLECWLVGTAPLCTPES